MTRVEMVLCSAAKRKSHLEQLEFCLLWGNAKVGVKIRVEIYNREAPIGIQAVRIRIYKIRGFSGCVILISFPFSKWTSIL